MDKRLIDSYAPPPPMKQTTQNPLRFLRAQKGTEASAGSRGEASDDGRGDEEAGDETASRARRRRGGTGHGRRGGRRLGPRGRRRLPRGRRHRRSPRGGGGGALAVADVGRRDLARVGEAQRAGAVDGEAQRRRVRAERHAQALRVRLHHLAQLRAARRRRRRHVPGDVAEARRQAHQRRRALARRRRRLRPRPARSRRQHQRREQ
jgi:hypothetical protein